MSSKSKSAAYLFGVANIILALPEAGLIFDLCLHAKQNVAIESNARFLLVTMAERKTERNLRRETECSEQIIEDTCS